MKTIRDFNIRQKRILVRCDFNVPINGNGDIADDFRIRQTLPTIRYLIEGQAKVILMSHLGDPVGQVNPLLKMDKIEERIEKLLGISIKKTDDCIGPEVQEAAADIKPGEILLLENVRFHQGETGNDSDFARQLAELADIYLNDAFGVCHRRHASVVLVPQFLPHGMGLLLEKEIENLNKVLKSPARPLVAVVGGKKVQDKSAFIEKMSALADLVIVSGLIKKELEENYSDILQNVRIIGPEENLEALDIDDKNIKIFTEKILEAKTIVWNGPFGKFEDEQYKKGTLEIAKAIIESGAFSVVGGGETVEFLHQEGLIEKFNWVSTGGGAMLAYLSGEKLPGLAVLE